MARSSLTPTTVHERNDHLGPTPPYCTWPCRPAPHCRQQTPCPLSRALAQSRAFKVRYGAELGKASAGSIGSISQGTRPQLSRIEEVDTTKNLFSTDFPPQPDNWSDF